MSECVVRMEMPQKCFNCDLRYECNAFYAPGKPKPFMKGCRIVCQLPKGHGDLIDRNDFIKMWKKTKKKRFFISGLDVAWLAHVTVPEERSET